MILQNSKTYIRDLDIAINNTVHIEKLIGSSILITGATGTIGSFVVDMLLRYNQVQNADIKVFVAGRNLDNIYQQFIAWNDPNLYLLQYDILKPITFTCDIDYVIHIAGNAHPAAFNGDPVGTIMGNINSTYNLLQYTNKHRGKRLLYVSSGEVYGQGDLSLEEFSEDYSGRIEILSPRFCYPQSKRTAENLCVAFSNQYRLETVIVRPCHTYGPNITPNDNRANAQFIHDALNNEDIVMKSSGSQIRSYIYTADCASGILTVLINGKSGEAYNIANSNIRITIAQLAELIATVVNKKVVFSESSTIGTMNNTPFAKQVLSSKKIEALGWCSVFSVETGIKHTINILQGE